MNCNKTNDFVIDDLLKDIGSRAQDLRILGPISSIPMASEVSSAVRALNTSVSEMDMSLGVVDGGVCKGTVGTELGELVVNTEGKYWLKREALS